MFVPVIPSDGLVGWRFLQRTYDAQVTAFTRSGTVQRDTAYFAERIPSVQRAADLVSDRRLLTVALGAFGLEGDLNNRFFIQKILEEGTVAPDALANRLTDSRYRRFAAAFQLGPGETPATTDPGFAVRLVAQFEANSFEVAAGAQDDAMRVALYGQRTLDTLAASPVSNDAKWFTILGDPPLRRLFEGALGLPEAVGQIDIDQQLNIFKERTAQIFGQDTVAQFTASDLRTQLINRYVARDQLINGAAGQSGAANALTLLRG